MIRSIRILLSLGLMVMLVGVFQTGCGGGEGECSSNKDCIDSKGKDYKCVTVNKKKTCKKADAKKCDPACLAGETCKDGTCKKEATGDCGGKTCAAGEECKADVCTKKTDPNLCGGKTCAADEECKADVCTKKPDPNLCGGKTCAAGEECKADVCTKKPDPNLCGGKTCAAGEICKANKCEKAPAGGGEAGDACQQNGCKAGLKCIEVAKGKSFCFRDCTTNAKACDASGQKCVKASDQINICLTESSEGGPCGLEGKTQANCGQGLACSNGKCVKTKEVGLYEKCGIDSKVCSSKNVCLRFGTNDKHGYCVTKCDPTKASTCGSDVTCRALQNGAGFCNIVGSAASGAACVGDISTKGEKLNTHEICGKGLGCSNGKCEKPKEVALYAKCGTANKACSSKNLCLLLESGAKHGYCLGKCDPANPQCPGGAECLKLNNGGGACRYTGTVKKDGACKDIDTKGDKLNVGEVCEPKLACVSGKCATTVEVGTGEPCGQGSGKVCKKGLSCVNIGSPICMQFWDGDCKTAGKTCGAGEVCVPLNGGGKTYGGCFVSCAGGKKCASNLECRANSNNTCWPLPPVGTAAFGSKCKNGGAKAEICQKGLRCTLAQKGATEGFCSKQCAQDSDCPSYKNAAGKGITASCIVASKICVFTCDQPGQICPDGLKCIGSQLCGP